MVVVVVEVQLAEINTEWNEEVETEAGAHFFLAQIVDSCSQSVTVVSGDYTD